jgi:hypothetical protein
MNASIRGTLENLFVRRRQAELEVHRHDGGTHKAGDGTVSPPRVKLAAIRHGMPRPLMLHVMNY